MAYKVLVSAPYIVPIFERFRYLFDEAGIEVEIAEGCPKRASLTHHEASNLRFSRWSSTTPSVRATGDVREHALPIRLVYG